MSLIKEIKVSYSVGRKINTGNFENVDFHLSETVMYDVAELDAHAIDALSDASYAELKEKLDTRLIECSEELIS